MAALAYRYTPDLFDEPLERRAEKRNRLFGEIRRSNKEMDRRFAPEETQDDLVAREMPLRSTAGLGERRFTAWRGRSGRRYVASVFSIDDVHALGFIDAVLLAVSPDRRIIAARDSGPFGVEAALSRWQRAIMAAGAAEIHVHLLAEDGLSRRAALLDLMPEACPEG
ncbi:hypothetical protein [Bosea sp. TAF32]|uniref:hypothetical protein n=1 Tax=Bosea sp. TAF32 TaxID=3237482 RepID=UPI003F908382